MAAGIGGTREGIEMTALICVAIAAVAYLVAVVLIQRKKAHVAAVRRLIEQNNDHVAKMTKAMNDQDWAKFDRYYWRSNELGQMIDREIERL